MNKRIILTLVTLVVIAVAISTQSRHSFSTQSDHAEALVLERKYVQAIDIYETLLKDKPKDAAMWSDLSDVYYDMARYDDALYAIIKACELKPHNLSYSISKATIYESMDLQVEANDIYANMTEKYTDISIIEDIPTLLSLGFATNHLGLFERSIQTYKRALELEPTNTSSMHQLAWAYMDYKAFDKAIATFERAIELAPDDSLNYVYLGDCYYDLGNYDEAIFKYKSALELEPESVLANLKLADCYEALGNYHLVTEYLNRHIQADPYDFYEYARLIRFYTDLKRYKRAFDTSQLLIEVNPNDPYAYELQANTLYLMDNMVELELALSKMYAHLSTKEKLYNIGKWFMDYGEHDLALKYFNQCIDEFPMFIEGYHTIANVYESIDRQDDIEILFNRLIEVYDEETALNAKFRHYSNSDQLSNSAQLTEITQRLVDIKPRNNEYWLRLGKAYSFNNEYEKSNAVYQEMLTLFPESYEPYYYQANNYVLLEDFENALIQYELASNLNLSDAYLYYHYARCYALLDMDAQALKHLKTAIQIKPSFESKLSNDELLSEYKKLLY